VAASLLEAAESPALSRTLPSLSAASLAAEPPLRTAVDSSVDVLRMASSTGLLMDSAACSAGTEGGAGVGAGETDTFGAGVGVAGTAGFAGVFSASFRTFHKSLSVLGSATVAAATVWFLLKALPPAIRCSRGEKDLFTDPLSQSLHFSS